MNLAIRRISTTAKRTGLVSVLSAVLVVLAATAWPGPARAVLELDITSGNPQPVAIAIPAFEDDTGQGKRLGQQISDVITGDLVSSGLFKSMNRAAFIAKAANFNHNPRFGDWRIINAQALLTGRVSALGDGRVKAEFRLWDVFAGKQLAGQQFFTRPENWRQLAHVIADTVYQRITGESGYFDTRIVFIHETGPKDARVKRLAIMDQDGYNVRMLTEGRSLVLTPRFSPTRQEITYMSYEAGRPRVYLFNLETREKEIIGDFRGMSFSPRFSPDGHRIIMSLSHDGFTNIYTMDLRSRRTRRLTNTQAIDTAPCYSPDGRSIVFESDRTGSQQIYVMNSDGTNQRRISFGEGSYSTPVWSPRGDLIAFTKRVRGRFLIGVMRTDGSGERILTEGYHNEGPTWAPNGRVLMFFRESPGPKGGPRLFTIDLTGYNERRIATPSFGSDPAWSPLID